jgi:hypothetical protein
MTRLLPILLLGCGAPFGSSHLTRHGTCGTPTDGIVSLAWTIRSAAPSTQSCSSIDHMSIQIENGSCGATIEPVPCALDRWRYDGMPEGPVDITVTALDRNNNVVASGSLSLQLSTAAPAAPSPLDLR